MAVCCEHGHETSGSIKRGGFLDQLSDYHLLKKDYVLHGVGYIHSCDK
jgi:hypothetical protein